MARVTSTHDALVEAATDLLEEGGVSAVTLREVGRRSGVSHNAPYKHFADKEQLLAAVAARYLSRQYDASRRVRRGRSGLEFVKVMLHSRVRYALAHPELFKLTYGPWRQGSDELGRAADGARSFLVAAVTTAQENGELPSGDPDRLTALLLALTHGAADLALSGHLARDGKGHASPADLVDDLLYQLQQP
jgi:AcrR family transcriptional regulator